MTCTLFVAAPVTAIGGVVMALREDTGLSWILVVSIPILAVCLSLVISRMVPQFRLLQARIDAAGPQIGQARAALASAERYSLEGGQSGLALRNAETAMQGLPEGTPDWIRAQDIALVARAEVERERKRR